MRKTRHQAGERIEQLRDAAVRTRGGAMGAVCQGFFSVGRGTFASTLTELHIVLCASQNGRCSCGHVRFLVRWSKGRPWLVTECKGYFIATIVLGYSEYRLEITGCSVPRLARPAEPDYDQRMANSAEL